MGQSSGTLAGARLDRLPMTKRHYSVMFLLAGGGFFDGFDIYLAGSVLAAMVATHFSTVGQNAQFISATFFGLLLGALGAAALGDRFGRRFTSRYSLLVYGLATVACAVVPSLQGLLAARFIAGLGLGAVIVTSYGLWVEFVPKRSRGFWTGMMSFIINLSQPAAALAALLLIPHYGWRSLFWLAGIPPLVIWLLQVLYLPESPRWLEIKGRHQEAEAVLRQFEQGVEGLPPLAAGDAGAAVRPAGAAAVRAAGDSVTGSESTAGAASGHPARAVSLWSPGVRKITVLSIIVSVLTLVTWYTFTAWIPTFFVKQGISQVKTFTFSFVIMLGAIPGNALAAWLSDRVGRKWTLAIISIILAVLGVLYGYSTTPAAIMTLGFLFVAGGNILIAIILASYIPEMFPTSVRMAGSSLANAFGRAGTIVSPYMIAYLFQRGGQYAVFWTSFAMYLVMAACILWLGLETKKKSLEEIEQEERGGIGAVGTGSAAAEV
ncbi:MFS transporter [Alicyclobacillus macrosporangiidus]|uniref:MFS transporter n=1 Tax=Alicyclobacillus macrosporangiidus TaxID=392015 RepID=UPI00068A8690|nr:MFS transporter [Alicyclobacillus macrosporangiidus]